MRAQPSWLLQVPISEDTAVAKTVAQQLIRSWGHINPVLPGRAEKAPRGSPASLRQGVKDGVERRQKGEEVEGTEGREHSSELIFVVSSLASLLSQAPSDSPWEPDHITSLLKVL